MDTDFAEQTAKARRQRAVGSWLLLGVVMLIIQILLGGITRLTGSGLSITEWKPVLGAVPPLSEGAWQVAFQKYQGIAQYRYLNAHFTITDFKHIYFWEWMHREWARLVGVVFIIGFIWFAVKRYFNREMIVPFIILFIIGVLQGAIGWIMVQSGLNDTNLYVSHIRLAIHFMSALLLLCYTLWFALKLRVPARNRISSAGSLRRFTLATILVLCIQLIWGAFMAGLKAASVAPTWPTINGLWLPNGLGHYGARDYAGLSIITSQPIAVHFIHRTLAYLLLAMIVAWAIAAAKTTRQQAAPTLRRWYIWPLLLVCIQVLLGIFTVLNGGKTAPAGHFGSFELLAQAHQLVAMCLLVALVANLYLMRTGLPGQGMKSDSRINRQATAER